MRPGSGRSRRTLHAARCAPCATRRALCAVRGARRAARCVQGSLVLPRAPRGAAPQGRRDRGSGPTCQRRPPRRAWLRAPRSPARGCPVAWPAAGREKGATERAALSLGEPAAASACPSPFLQALVLSAYSRMPADFDVQHPWCNAPRSAGHITPALGTSKGRSTPSMVTTERHQGCHCVLNRRCAHSADEGASNAVGGYSG